MSKKFVLAKDVQEWLDGRKHPRKNLYTCTDCHGSVVTVDIDNGVTPFMISCRATQGCKGFMESHFYNCDPMLPADYEWYRPETIEGLAPETQEHVKKGGLLLRPITPWLSDVPHDA